jgi:hypothetical protein
LVYAGANTVDETTLERLMMDDALEALGPDVKELLGAYIQSSAADAKRHGQWMRLGAAAEEAVRVAPLDKLPPFPGRGSRSLRLWGETLAIAAAVIVGIAVGLVMQKPQEARTVAVQTSAPVAAQPAEMLGVADFWSSKRLLAEALAAPRNPSNWPNRMTPMGDQR